MKLLKAISQKSILIVAVLSLALVATQTLTVSAAGKVEKKAYGKTADGAAIDEYTLTNASGAEVKIITYGGIITSIKVPDRNGSAGKCCLGFDKLEDYLTRSPYFGSITGRYGNRIAKAKFSLDGKEYTLAANNGPNYAARRQSWASTSTCGRQKKSAAMLVWASNSPTSALTAKKGIPASSPRKLSIP